MTSSLPVPLAARPAMPSPGFWRDLARHGEAPALLSEEGVHSYLELAGRVAARRDALGPTRRLVLLAGRNDVETVVSYLACLAGGHPVVLTAPDPVARGDLPGPAAADRLATTYDVDVVLAGDQLRERRPGRVRDAQELHPDLALMLSTSGSAGSPKLVRLSHDNLASNAAAIADYLAIRRSDVAATTLPLHYCYGRSVLDSHLAAGAALWLTDLSVVDACFWEGVHAHGVTTFPGVPYTFDLLDRVGFDGDVPSLRYLTQAGGRLDPERVRRYVDLGRRRGFDLVVMYGQTEATARMAYLPPDLAAAAPTAIGVPIPGGELRLEPLPERPVDPRPEALDPAAGGEPSVGELVYTGPNVMLGYAEGPGDLARGREVEELRTGDVARRRDDGLLEVVGRRTRLAKVFGLRIDLDQVERALADAGHVAYCADAQDRLVVTVESGAAPVDPVAVRALVRSLVGLPPSAVGVLAVPVAPRLPSGKVDYRALASLGARAGRDQADSAGPGPRAADLDDVRAVVAEVLGRDDVGAEDTFVGLGGDSLSYVEMSLRLEALLGTLPAGWHLLPLGELARHVPPRTTGKAGRHRRHTLIAARTVETNVLLRALAIVLIVGTHANLLLAAGGGHVLLALAGFNVGRFHMTDAPRPDRVRRLVVSTSRVAVPSVLWLAGVALLTGDVGWRNVLLVNWLLGPTEWAEPQWWYWFVEVLVWTLLGLTALAAVPALHRLERRHPFGLPLGLATAGLLTRYDLVTLSAGDDIHRASVVFWLVALGWAAAKASRDRHRVALSLLAVVSVPGFLGSPGREAVVVAGLLLLVWVPALRVPAGLARAAGLLAGASLFVYLVHWQVYPHLEDRFPLAATGLSLLAGVLVWRVWRRGERLAARVGAPGGAPR